MKKLSLIIALMVIIIFDVLLRYTIDIDYYNSLVYFFSSSYLLFLFLAQSTSRDLVLRLSILSHFVILFLFLSMDIYSILDGAFGYGHVGDWWTVVIKMKSFIYPNLIGFIIISIILFSFGKPFANNRLYYIITFFVLIVSIVYGGIFFYYTNFMIPLDFIV